ncbi:MAG: helix-turn-helix domain-containing protein [Candidatus Bathyarchaeota archaeon]|nr:helix-turn-helix domain-containing protein [Candidatus Bathyarchaeota archaeon]
MTKHNDEAETIIFQALSHPMRRAIIELINANPTGTAYTELITDLSLPTGKINYHLEQLAGLIEKNEQHHYILTPLGKKALNQLKQLKVELTTEDEKYLNLAQKSQKTSLEPTLKSFLIIGIIASLTVIFLTTGLCLLLLVQGELPTLMLAVFIPGIMIEVAVFATLIYALRNAPAWLRRLEKRFLATP